MPTPTHLAKSHADDIASATGLGVPGRVFAAIDALDAMTDGERVTVFSIYCRHCGSADPRCVCMRDE